MNVAFPEQTTALVQRANALLRRGRNADGARALRRALDLAPRDAAVVSALAAVSGLGRSLLTHGRAREAVAALAPVAESRHATGELLMLYGYALMSEGHKHAAETAWRRWTEKDPGSRDAAWRFAAALADNGKPTEAETAVRADIARHGEAPDAAFVLGRALLGQARFDEAEAQFQKVVRARPDHRIAQANLMELVWMRSGDVHAAGRALDEALKAQPGHSGLRITKARLLVSARLPREALAEIDTGLAIAAQDAGLLAAAVTIALEVDGARAFEYAQRLATVAPQDRASRVALGNASLATGRPKQTLAIAETLHQAAPTDGRALAMKADALRILDDPRYRTLLDYQGLVRAELIEAPDGWVDLESYLCDLIADLDRSHTLYAHPIGNSLREGSQIQLDPQRSAFASIRAFPQAIDGPIRKYMRAIGKGNDPMRRRNRGRYALSGMWSVRLRPHGFHVNHYHPEGWISSACYLRLPAAVGQHRGEGWLKFGEPAFPTQPTLTPEYFIQPEPGLLALFPAYMWHGTVPFGGKPEDNRLTIAFDVVPA